MTIKIHGKDCAFCLLYVSDDGDDHDNECLLLAYDRTKDGPGESCPGPGEYELRRVGGSEPHEVSEPVCEPLKPGPGCDCGPCQFRKQCEDQAKKKWNLDVLVAAVERYEAIEAEYAKYRNRDRVNEPKGTLEEADRLAGLSMRQDKIVREAAIAFVRGLGRKG